MRRPFLLLLFCLSLLQLRAQDSPVTIDVAIITLKLERKADNTDVSITNSARIRTNMNRTHPSYRDWNENDFVCFLINTDEQILDTFVLRHPLKPKYEYPAENGTIGSIAVDIPSNEVLIRFPYRETMRYLQVSEVTNRRQLNTLTKLLLPLHE